MVGPSELGRFRSNWADIGFLLLALPLLLWVTWDGFTWHIVTTSPGADFWEHAPVVRSLLQDPWYPANPHLLSPDSSPRFVPLFVVAALLGRLLHSDTFGCMGIVALLNTTLFLAGSFVFYRTYFREPLASLYGLIVAFGSWYGAFHYSNVYELQVYFTTVTYPSTTALALSWFGFAQTLRVLRGSPTVTGCLATAVLWSLVTITHPLTAVMSLLGAGLLAVAEPDIPWRSRWLVLGAIATGVLAAEAWPYFSLHRALVGTDKGVLQAMTPHWAETISAEPGSAHHFYRVSGLLRTLGFALLGLPSCVYLIFRRQHWFISLGALGMLGLFALNARVPLPLGHRFVLLAVPFLQMALVWLCLTLTPGNAHSAPWLNEQRARISNIFVGALLAFMLWNTLHTALKHVKGAHRRMPHGESPSTAMARRVVKHAGEHAVVLGNAKTSWPLPTFGPRIVLLLHANPLVHDEVERENDVARVLSPDATESQRVAVLQRYAVTHLLLNRSESERLKPFLSARTTRTAINHEYTLYTWKEPG